MFWHAWAHGCQVPSGQLIRQLQNLIVLRRWEYVHTRASIRWELKCGTLWWNVGLLRNEHKQQSCPRGGVRQLPCVLSLGRLHFNCGFGLWLVAVTGSTIPAAARTTPTPTRASPVGPVLEIVTFVSTYLMCSRATNLLFPSVCREMQHRLLLFWLWTHLVLLSSHHSHLHPSRIYAQSTGPIDS